MLESKRDTLFSTIESATYLGVTTGRIRQMLVGERFPNAVKIGRDWLIPVSDLNAVKNRKTGRPPKESR